MRLGVGLASGKVHSLATTPDCCAISAGFYVVDRRQGNTGGLGGAFGYFYGTGNPLPIPECQPYKPSKRFRLLNLVGRIGARLKGGGAAAPAARAAAPAATGGATVVQAMKFMQDPSVTDMTVKIASQTHDWRHP